MKVMSGAGRHSLIEIAELVIQTFFELCVVPVRRAGALGRWRRVATREAGGGNGHADGAARTDQIGKQPGEAVEPAIDRRAQDVLPPIFLDERDDHFLPALALLDHGMALRLLPLS